MGFVDVLVLIRRMVSGFCGCIGHEHISITFVIFDCHHLLDDCSLVATSIVPELEIAMNMQNGQWVL